MSWKSELPKPTTTPNAPPDRSLYVTRDEAKRMADVAAFKAVSRVVKNLPTLVEESVSKALELSPEDIESRLSEMESEKPFPSMKAMDGDADDDFSNDGAEELSAEDLDALIAELEGEPPVVSEKAMETDEDEDAELTEIESEEEEAA